MDDEAPLRRSLRVAGMTPLRPMSTIMLSEQQRRIRSRSRTGTPRKGNYSSAARMAPDSRTRQLFNLPSDISTSDFLGDTPTARFYHAKSSFQREHENLATVVARRSTNSTATAAVGVQTVKARRLAKQPSNVFLTQDNDNGMLGAAALGSFRVFSWIAACFHGILYALFNTPLVFYKNVEFRKVKTAMVVSIGGLAVCLMLYAFSQLDTVMAPSEMVRLSPLKPLVQNPSSPPLPSGSDGENLLLNLEIMKQRLADIEISVSQAKNVFGAPIVTQKSMDEMEKHIKLLAQKEVSLESQVADMISNLNNVVSTISKPTASQSEVSNLLDKFNAMSQGLQTVKADIMDLKEQVGLNVIRNSIRRELVDVLPEHLLVKKNSDGSVSVDPALLKALNGLIVGRTPSSEGASNESSISLANADFESIENMLNGKLNQLQHQIISREAIIALISRKIQDEMVSVDEARKRFTDQMNQVQVLNDRHLELETKLHQDDVMREQLKKWIERELVLIKRGELADDVGMADYALETMGARPIVSKTSASFFPSAGAFFGFFGPVARPKPPNLVLRPDNSLGNCWAFPGSQGFVTVALGISLVPTHFSIDHVPGSLQVDRSSAPREFSVYGHSELREKPILLGQYEYTLDKEPVQTFATQYILTKPVRFVRLVVNSNHGKGDYTCIYRFRVHSSTTHNATISEIFGDAQ